MLRTDISEFVAFPSGLEVLVNYFLMALVGSRDYFLFCIVFNLSLVELGFGEVLAAELPDRLTLGSIFSCNRSWLS